MCGARIIDLMGGALAPGLTTFGSGLGLNKIKLERSTAGGRVFDALTMARAFDGLQIAGRNTLYTYRRGVTTAVVAPTGSGFLQGISTAFSTGAPNALADRAILQSATALHISIQSEMRASVSTQIAALRNVLFSSSAPGPWRRVKAGEIPLIVKIHNPDIMTTLLLLKAESDASTSAALRMTFAGAPPRRPDWRRGRQCDPRPRAPVPRILGLPPRHGITLALGVPSDYGTRNVIYARFELALPRWTQTALSTTNVDKALGLDSAEDLRSDKEIDYTVHLEPRREMVSEKALGDVRIWRSLRNMVSSAERITAVCLNWRKQPFGTNIRRKSPGSPRSNSAAER
ncbi:hypothetical protein FB451DRAFT_1375453 [Mycena latifolia]|nr:hypothetical protein FB451DRAFT_1375453 [Mycena latifolia]